MGVDDSKEVEGWVLWASTSSLYRGWLIWMGGGLYRWIEEYGCGYRWYGWGVDHMDEDGGNGGWGIGCIFAYFMVYLLTNIFFV